MMCRKRLRIGLRIAESAYGVKWRFYPVARRTWMRPGPSRVDKKAGFMNIYEFARRCGVSIGTVSRAINNRKDVDPATRAMVLKRMVELGYQPNRTARALSTGRTQIISVWIGQLSSRYGAMVLQHIEQHLRDSNYEMLVRDLKYRRPDDGSSLPLETDGLMVVDAVPWVRWLREHASPGAPPMVNLGVYADPSVDHVVVNPSQGVRESVLHLTETGSRRPALLSPKGYNTFEEPRYRAYMETIQELGLSAEVIPTEADTRAAAIEALEAYVPAKGAPDGLVCFNDDHAIAAVKALRSLGVRVPEDTAIVGFDGIEETEYLERPLSTVVVPVAAMCEAAWGFLERRMRTPDLPLQRLELEPRLEVRATSRPVRALRRARGRTSGG